MLGLAPMAPLFVWAIWKICTVLGKPNIKTLGRKGDASQGGEKRRLGMEEGNYQATHEILHPLSPLPNKDHVGTPLLSIGHSSSWLQDPPKNIS